MVVKILLLIWTLLEELVKGSTVIDKADQQDGIYYNDYCPNSPHCPEGSHTLCLYYDPNRKYGPACHNVMEHVTMTKEYSDLILDTINKYRGDVAMGEVRGQNNMQIPRAYGLYELKWDSELATFAQLYANNCPMVGDICRATKKFSDPAQFMVIADYEHEEDEMRNKEVHNGIKESMELAYNQRIHVNEYMIKKLPDWNEHPHKTKGKLFMDMLHSKPTHIGCGIIISDIISESQQLVHHLVIVCNLSHKPTPGMPLYDTEPSKTKPTNETTKICPGLAHCEVRFIEELPSQLTKCGCPPGTKETDRCLCRHSNQMTPVVNACKDQCESIVLLPIFTEDNGSKSMTKQDLTEIFMPETESQSPDLNEVFGLDFSRGNDFALYKNEDEDISHEYVIHTKFPHAKKMFASQQDTTWISDQQPKHHWHRQFMPILKSNNKNKIRRSIFASAPKFQLRNTGKNHHSKPAFKNVTASKYFSTTKQALFKYLAEKRKREKVILNHTNDKSEGTVDSNEDNLEIKQQSDDHQTVDEITEATTENENTNENEPPADAEIPIDFYNGNSHADVNTDEPIKEPETKNINKERCNGTGNKLIKLLDTVEKEIRNSRIDSSEKEIVHAKIKKIFDTVIGKPKASTELLPVETSSEDYQSNTPFDINTGLSEGEFETKTRVEDEEKILFPIRSDEFRDYKGMRPIYHYRDGVNIANSENLESTIPFNKDEHPSYYLEDREPITHKLYTGLDGEKQKNIYNKNFQRDYSFKDKFKGPIANNHMMSNKFIKHDTETDYDEDLLDEERRKFYQEKIEELDNHAYQQRNNDMGQQQPEDMRERTQDVEERQAQGSQFYKNYHTRFIQEY